MLAIRWCARCTPIRMACPIRVLTLRHHSRARLFYHKPRFAVLDQCTDAVSVDVEEALYDQARKLGVTIITISQRPSTHACMHAPRPAGAPRAAARPARRQRWLVAQKEEGRRLGRRAVTRHSVLVPRAPEHSQVINNRIRPGNSLKCSIMRRERQCMTFHSICVSLDVPSLPLCVQ